ncbi:hypothetical protein LTR17_015835 [Elasticomyces elasticus]|nr:hypothetical protein LTR17_015835 [Elasticomyces elasticus]
MDQDVPLVGSGYLPSKPLRALEEAHSKPLWVDGPIWTKAFNAYIEHDYEFRAFEALHLLSVKSYERELIDVANKVVTKANEQVPAELDLHEIRDKLKLYCDAVDSLEKVLGRRITASGVPKSQATILETAFRLDVRSSYTPSNDRIRKISSDLLPGWFSSTFLETLSPHLSLTIMIERLTVAFFGGASLLVPMIIMTFRTSRTARLVTVCVATLLFAYAIALFTSAKKQDILGATAAYAAVMVVYVGTVLPSSS